MGATSLLMSCAVMCFILYSAFTIRLHAVNTYGRVIHEFDPWFNYRATEYLNEHGYFKFIDWFDYSVWYPLGRPVGTTTYAGMLVTSSAIFKALSAVGIPMSLNDVCVFVPAWFGVLATIFTFLLAYEATKNRTSAIAAAGIMAILPAHLMRSIGGGYDNEAVAVSAIVGTFYFWVRSLRGPKSWPWAFAAALSYIYMVSAWGGYIFVLNMIGVHAAVLLFLGRYSLHLNFAYTLWYVIGTYGAMQFPVVGQAPIRSLEQLGPMGVLFLMQVCAGIDYYRIKNNISGRQLHMLRLKVLAGGIAALVVLLMAIAPTGYLGPLSARIRGLFVQHTRTGNPLVDSVAEHQATQPRMYWQYFHFVMYFSMFGLVPLLSNKRTNASLFAVIYYCTSFYFSRKMVRLILILAPAASVTAGAFIGIAIDWVWTQATLDPVSGDKSKEAQPKSEKQRKEAKKSKSENKKKDAKKRQPRNVTDAITTPWRESYEALGDSRRFVAMGLGGLLAAIFMGYWAHCNNMAVTLSNPSIMLKAKSNSGEDVIIDDFREAYWWLRDETPEDSRVLSWWDYGYQINGVANRTTIADGNTWNHEHIALLGKVMVSSVKNSHKIARHLADYVLVWSTKWGGMYGDDLAKSPHMARISGSVYKDIDASKFFLDANRNPSPMMKESLVYTLHSYKFVADVPNPEKYFKEVYTSKNNMVRIYKVQDVSQKSKDYVTEYHTYPPALDKIISQKQDFQQLEDFNRKKSEFKQRNLA